MLDKDRQREKQKKMIKKSDRNPVGDVRQKEREKRKEMAEKSKGNDKTRNFSKEGKRDEK